MTNHGAPNYRIIAISANNPAVSHWKEILPEGKDEQRFKQIEEYADIYAFFFYNTGKGR